MIVLLVKVPSKLQGASLLGVHNWVKSQITVTNPGSALDYKLRDRTGNPITLSDVSRNPGQEIFIEFDTPKRSNPPNNLTMIPELEVDYPSLTQGGNNLTSLLPGDIDSAMATRIIAEQGLRRGLHTLNRLTIKKEDVRISSPTTAALMQMGEVIRSNPSVRRNSSRTPFTKQTPINYSSERGLAEYLIETSNTDLDPADIKGVTPLVHNTKIAARYGLNERDIRQFARDVLSDYLIAASSNRGLLRTLLRRMPDLREDNSTIQKLVYMFPQQPKPFYNGRQGVFVASAMFMYPFYAERALSNRDVNRIVQFARGYPNNVRGGDGQVRIPRGLSGLLGTMRISAGGVFQAFRSFIRGQGTVEASDGALEAAFAADGYLPTIATRLGRDPAVLISRRGEPRIYFYEDLGGFYPTPPPKWPTAIVYAIMDAFLENLPHLLDPSNPMDSRMSTARLAFFATPSEKLVINVSGKEIGFNADELKKIQDDNPISAGATLADYNAFFVAMGLEEQATLASAQTQYAVTVNAIENSVRGVIAGGGNALKMESTLEFDTDRPKSVIELAYDVAEIASNKYDYNVRGDDFKFIMAVVYQSFTTLQSRDLAPTFGDIYGAVLGAGAAANLDAIQSRLEEGEVYGEDANAVARQVLRLARVMDMTNQLDAEPAGSVGPVDAAEIRTFIDDETMYANLSPNRSFAGEMTTLLNSLRVSLERAAA